jgi:hypothetical protein
MHLYRPQIKLDYKKNNYSSNLRNIFRTILLKVPILLSSLFYRHFKMVLVVHRIIIHSFIHSFIQFLLSSPLLVPVHFSDS